ncbi:MAE_28990/MAE_18760 family HEPN-like nuclease [Hymenobacter sp. DH14]|uniref:MAE_28990/MAE_18760 family HEPN-like nuclease n=1 Tax=Hymenobacter cyanobacteriorum TaxID=2926463 RepID=A0A9X1VJ02_9BACT|nr:MAE_28990/MAE_18760 family HEPN-like nuclease [Hymenobacter cyanobacteriorum]MCI1189510.1 MAE_28990/MAE_18760 family HEPN-like nuclease [Hymenobacter cyanobacteriorum]
MKGGTAEELYDFMSREIAWRRKELDDIRGLISANSSIESKRRVLLRSGITMLYAHWEGFVKNTGKAYINFVGKRRFKYNELSVNFLALSLRQKISFVNADSIASLIDLVTFFEGGMNDRISSLSKEEVNTKYNLNSTVLKNIILSLGLEPDDFISKGNLIDVKLLDKRNAIAHGRDILIDEEEYVELLDNVLALMNGFRNQIDNAVTQEKYKRQ